MQDDHFSSMILALEQNGVTRTQIAQNCGLSRATVWRLASGTKQEPSWRTVKSLQTFYDSEIFERVSPVKQKVV